MQSGAFEFRLPDIGEGVSEGEIVAWHVHKGEKVAEDQPMLDVMTDKVTVTIGSPRAGVIADVKAEVGQTVKVGAVVVVIEESGDRSRTNPPTHPPAAPESEQGNAACATETKASAVGDIRESLPGTATFQKRATKETEAAASKVLATPATRKLARDMGVDLREVAASGAASGDGGRVLKDDVVRFANGGAQAVASESAWARPSHESPSVSFTGSEERRPFVGLRRKIAERMQASKRTAAHFTFVEECEVTELKRLRERMQQSSSKAGSNKSQKVNYLPFIVKAVVLALKKHAIINSMLDDAKGELVYKNYYHIGIATATEQGLVVPVLRDADKRSILDIAREIDRLAAGARAGTLKPGEMTGSTFTITSLGQLGGLMATPVLNMPEVGILGVHRIKSRPVVRDGQLAIGDVMNLSLTLDHRIVDGHVGAAFTYDVIGYLEDPGTLLLELA